MTHTCLFQMLKQSRVTSHEHYVIGFILTLTGSFAPWWVQWGKQELMNEIFFICANERIIVKRICHYFVRNQCTNPRRRHSKTKCSIELSRHYRKLKCIYFWFCFDSSRIMRNFLFIFQTYFIILIYVSVDSRNRLF